MQWWYILLIVLCVLAAFGLGLVWLCAYTAKKYCTPFPSARRSMYGRTNTKCRMTMYTLPPKTK